MPTLPEAACKGEDPEIFFGPHVCDDLCEGPDGCMTGKSEQGRFNRIQKARRICGSCDERIACLEWAITNDQKFGVWGGMTEREREKIRKKRREGRRA